MLRRLRKVLAKEGALSMKIIDSAPGLPSSSTYAKHFGTLRGAYRLIGYTGSKYCNNVDASRQWTELSMQQAAQLREYFEKRATHVIFDSTTRCLRINDTVNVGFAVAKWRKYVGRGVRWPLVRRVQPTGGWVVAMRLGEGNTSVLDYVLVPATSFSYRVLWLSEHNLKRNKVVIFRTFDELVRSLARRVSAESQVAPRRKV
jgi:hypothetical protein